MKSFPLYWSISCLVSHQNYGRPMTSHLLPDNMVVNVTSHIRTWMSWSYLRIWQIHTVFTILVAELVKVKYPIDAIIHTWKTRPLTQRTWYHGCVWPDNAMTPAINRYDVDQDIMDCSLISIKSFKIGNQPRNGYQKHFPARKIYEVFLHRMFLASCKGNARNDNWVDNVCGVPFLCS